MTQALTRPAIDPLVLIGQLNSTFPGIWARLLEREAGLPPNVQVLGYALMPDGYPIFSEIFCDQPEYDGALHEGFSAWLELRGWYVEPYDAARLDLYRISEAEEAMDDYRAAVASVPPMRKLAAGECPF